MTIVQFILGALMSGFGVSQIVDAAAGSHAANSSALLLLVGGYCLFLLRLSSHRTRQDVLPNVEVRSIGAALRSLPWGGITMFVAIVVAVLFERVLSGRCELQLAILVGASILGVALLFAAGRVYFILRVGLPSRADN